MIQRLQKKLLLNCYKNCCTFNDSTRPKIPCSVRTRPKHCRSHSTIACNEASALRVWSSDLLLIITGHGRYNATCMLPTHANSSGVSADYWPVWPPAVDHAWRMMTGRRPTGSNGLTTRTRLYDSNRLTVAHGNGPWTGMNMKIKRLQHPRAVCSPVARLSAAHCNHGAKSSTGVTWAAQRDQFVDVGVDYAFNHSIQQHSTCRRKQCKVCALNTF